MEYPERLELTDIERAFYEYDKNSSSNVVITVHLEGKIDSVMVEEALNCEKKRHFYLQYFIGLNENRPVFICDPDKKVPLFVHYGVDENFWIQVCEEEMNSLFDISRAPMIKANLIKMNSEEFILMITFSHIISDGISAVHFVRNVVQTMGESSEGKKIQKINQAAFQRPDSSCYSEAGAREPNFSFGNIEKDGLTIQTAQPESSPIFSENMVQDRKKRSKLLPVALSQEESRKVLSRCHDNGITVNTLLTSALIFAMRDYIEEKKPGSVPVWIKASTALDLRKYVQNKEVKPGDLGMWAGRCILYLNLNRKMKKEDFFDSYQAAISEYANNHPFYVVKAMAGGNLRVSQNSPKIKLEFPHIKITNLGDLQKQGFLNKYGKIQLKQIGFMTPLHRDWIDDLGYGLCTSTLNSSINLNFIYMEPVRNKKDAEEFSNRVLNYIQDI